MNDPADAHHRRVTRPHGQEHHGHGVSATTDFRYLAATLALLLAFMVAEVVVAITADSLALLADAGHMLTDAGALAASLCAIRLAAHPAAGAWTFGFKRAEVLSAAINGVTLLVVAVLVSIEAIRRLVSPPEVTGTALLVFALIGVVVNLAATRIMARANRTSINIQGAFQHILTDLYAFLGTAAAGAVILATGFDRADPIASLLVAGLMLRAAWLLLKASGRVLLEAAPESVDLRSVREHLLDLSEVSGVHDLHVWTVTSDLPALSAHIVVADDCFTAGHAPGVLDRLQACLGGHFDVEHSTFQLEPVGHTEHEAGAHP